MGPEWVQNGVPMGLDVLRSRDPGSEIPDPDPRARGLELPKSSWSRDSGSMATSTEAQSTASALGLETVGPEAQRLGRSNSPRGRNPNQSYAMVPRIDPGIMDPGITPDERSQRPTPRTEGVGHGVWRYPSARYVEYGVCVRCAHCVLVHTQRTSSAARGDVE
jgi:hypothetical protein